MLSFPIDWETDSEWKTKITVYKKYNLLLGMFDCYLPPSSGPDGPEHICPYKVSLYVALCHSFIAGLKCPSS